MVCDLLLLTAVVTGAASMPAPAGAQARPPAQPPDYSVDDEIVVPRDEGGPSVPVSDGRATPPECVWRRFQGDAMRSLAHLGPVPPRPSPDAYPILYMCNGLWVGGAENFRWGVPGVPAGPTMTGDEVAQTIYARLEGNLPEPEVASDPAAGEPAIISFPTFIQISNWTGTITDQECDPTGLLCVTVTATPSLSFAPGEPGAPTIACADGGTRFVEGGATSSVQAAQPGACAYAYQLRTGTGSRPPAWPGAATVTWDLEWGSTSGASGSLPDIVRTADVARQVNEVQTVIEQ
jgi:hypothetical protein